MGYAGRKSDGKTFNRRGFLNALDFTRQVHQWARIWELVYRLDFAWH